MADIKEKFGSSNQTITCSLAPGGTGLADSAARASDAVDNSSNLFAEALVFVSIKTGASSVSSSGYVNVYAYGTSDGGSHYTESATGSDASITLVSPSNLKLIGRINAVANATTYRAGPFSVAQAFGGSLPEKWGIVVENKTGAALDTTESNHQKVYQGVYSQAV